MMFDMQHGQVSLLGEKALSLIKKELLKNLKEPTRMKKGLKENSSGESKEIPNNKTEKKKQKKNKMVEENGNQDLLERLRSGNLSMKELKRLDKALKKDNNRQLTHLRGCLNISNNHSALKPAKVHKVYKVLKDRKVCEEKKDYKRMKERTFKLTPVRSAHSSPSIQVVSESSCKPKHSSKRQSKHSSKSSSKRNSKAPCGCFAKLASKLPSELFSEITALLSSKKSTEKGSKLRSKSASKALSKPSLKTSLERTIKSPKPPVTTAVKGIEKTLTTYQNNHHNDASSAFLLRQSLFSYSALDSSNNSCVEGLSSLRFAQMDLKSSRKGLLDYSGILSTRLDSVLDYLRAETQDLDANVTSNCTSGIYGRDWSEDFRNKWSGVMGDGLSGELENRWKDDLPNTWADGCKKDSSSSLSEALEKNGLKEYFMEHLHEVGCSNNSNYICCTRPNYSEFCCEHFPMKEELAYFECKARPVNDCKNVKDLKVEKVHNHCCCSDTEFNWGEIFCPKPCCTCCPRPFCQPPCCPKPCCPRPCCPSPCCPRPCCPRPCCPSPCCPRPCCPRPCCPRPCCPRPCCPRPCCPRPCCSKPCVFPSCC